MNTATNAVLQMAEKPVAEAVRQVFTATYLDGLAQADLSESSVGAAARAEVFYNTVKSAGEFSEVNKALREFAKEKFASKLAHQTRKNLASGWRAICGAMLFASYDPAGKSLKAAALEAAEILANKGMAVNGKAKLDKAQRERKAQAGKVAEAFGLAAAEHGMDKAQEHVGEILATMNAAETLEKARKDVRKYGANAEVYLNAFTIALKEWRDSETKPAQA